MGRDTTLYHITAISPDMQRIRFDVIAAGHETPRTIETDLKEFFAPATPCHLYEARRCPACRCWKDMLEFDVGNDECDDCSDEPGNWKQRASNLI